MIPTSIESPAAAFADGTRRWHCTFAIFPTDTLQYKHMLPVWPAITRHKDTHNFLIQVTCSFRSMGTISARHQSWHHQLLMWVTVRIKPGYLQSRLNCLNQGTTTITITTTTTATVTTACIFLTDHFLWSYFSLGWNLSLKRDLLEWNVLEVVEAGLFIPGYRKPVVF